MSRPISASNRPEVARYIADWKQQNEMKEFNFGSQTDRDAFLEALSDLGRHIAHTSRMAKFHVLATDSGINTVYLQVEN